MQSTFLFDQFWWSRKCSTLPTTTTTIHPLHFDEGCCRQGPIISELVLNRPDTISILVGPRPTDWSAPSSRPIRQTNLEYRRKSNQVIRQKAIILVF